VPRTGHCHGTARFRSRGRVYLTDRADRADAIDVAIRFVPSGELRTRARMTHSGC
jgi:hypothetical protein